MRSVVGCLLLCVTLFSATIHADTEEVTEGQKRLNTAQTIKALGPDLFGESTNFYNGVTTFSTTDIDIPGNNALPVRISRTRSGEKSEYFTNNSMLLDWELDLPYVYGVSPTGYPWQMAGSAPNNRCTANTSPNSRVTVGKWTPLKYWRGDFAHTPGSGNQSLISNLTAFKATDGQTTVAVTPKYWQLRCGPQIANPSSSGFSGEGFILLNTDGTKYTFNWMSKRQISSLTYTTAPPAGQTAPGTVTLARDEVRIYPTRIDDRFGNYVTYTWSGDQLTQISSSDGRTISLTYNSSNRLATAVAVATNPSLNKTWTYGYTGAGLSSVTLPDGTAWQYTFPSWNIIYGAPPSYLPATCNVPAAWNPSTQQQTVHVVHPSGAIGDFTFLLTRRGRTHVDNGCDPNEGQSTLGFKNYGPPIYTDNYSLSSKQISGPGLTTATWATTYAAPSGSDSSDTSPGGETTQTTVTNPDSSVIRYTFGIQYFFNEGKLLETQTLDPRGNVLRDVKTTFALNPSNPPYTFDLGLRYDNFAERFVTPRTQTTIVDSGTTYSYVVNSFDNMARELSVTRSNSLGSSRTDTTTYYDNTNRWVLGQVQTQTNADTNTVVSSTTFDTSATNTIKPATTSSFGLLQKAITYNADGTVSTVSDGLARMITFSSWKRGAPQNIKFPDNSTQSDVIDDLGLVSSTTDELSSTTNYSYDAAGRMTSLTWPTGDTVNWAPKAISYVTLSSGELGMPAGSWRMRLVEGSHQKSIYYDAKLNPVLEEEKDNSLNLVRYIRHGYDTMGRVTFESYPSTSYSVTAGINTAYDYLGRVTQKQTTDGITLSSTAYLSGNQLQVKDSASNVTTTSYQAFDKPAYDKALTVTAPQGQTTTYNLNVFGEVISATRIGSGLSLIETNVYDNNHRLCKVIRPESGQHIIMLDAASQMTWTASGTDVGTTNTNPNSCDYASVMAAQQTNFVYDSRGRKNQINYSDSSGNVAMSYDAAGRMTSVNTPSVSWTYTYNKRGLLETQTAGIDGATGEMITSYDVLGHVASETFPDGFNVAYAPNAWGEDTQVGSFATSIARQPNGVIQSALFGNGLTHATTLDSRLRVASQTVTGTSILQSLSYAYSNDSLLTGVTDNVDGTDTASFGYDGLHRLTTANGLWGNYTYGYDPLGNITSRSGTNALSYNYDTPTNRLSTVTGSTARTYGYDTRGRVTSDGRYGYNWNQADQLTGEPNTATYTYDGNGKRAKVVLANGTVEYALYDPSGKLRFTNLNGVLTDFIDLDGKTFVERTSSGVVTYLHPDWLGSPRMATSGVNGTMQWREHYDPYGKKLNGVTEKRGYTGHSYDRETGNTYMLARYYDADVGRFLMTDPIGSKDDLNLYAYVHGESTNSTDPTGTCSPRDSGCDGSDIGGGGFISDAIIDSAQNNTFNKPEVTPAQKVSVVVPLGKRVKAADNSKSKNDSTTEVADLRLGNTKQVFGLHEKLSVDTPDGEYGQSFGMSSRSDPQQGSSAAYGVAPAAGKKGSGVVYPDNDQMTSIKRTFKMTPSEDRRVEQYLRAKEGQTGPYNACTNSCRTYSNREYDAVVEMIQRERNQGEK